MPYSKMKLAVGFFVITLITVLSFFFYLILKEKGAFEKRYSYDFYAKSATAFKVGMPLEFSGFDVGMIDDIQLTNDGNVHLTFSVTQKNRKWISKDSILMLVKPLIGSPHIDVISVIGNPPLKENSTLQLVESDDINDMIARLQPVITKVINIIDNIDVITLKLSQDNGPLNQSMKNIEIVTARLAQNKSLLTSITGNQASTDALIGSLSETQKTIKQVHEITVKLDNLIGGLDSKMVKPSTELLNNINLIMLDVQKKLKAIDGTVNAVGGYDKDLSAIKEQVQLGLDKTNKVMDKVDSLLNSNKKSEVTLP